MFRRKTEKRAAKKIEKIKMDYFKNTKIKPLKPKNSQEGKEDSSRKGFVEGSLWMLTKIMGDAKHISPKINSQSSFGKESSFFEEVSLNDLANRIKKFSRKLSRYYSYIKSEGSNWSKGNVEEERSIQKRVEEDLESYRSCEISCDLISIEF